MAYTTVNKGSLFMNPTLYTGNSTATAHTVGFQPDFTWLKVRNASGAHYLFDSVRLATNYIQSNSNAVQGTDAQTLKSFDANGYTVGTSNSVNTNGETMVGWNWKAGTAVSGNTGGSGTAKTYTGSVNTTSGFSIIKYTGNGTLGHTIPHHLGVAPSMMIIKITAGDTSDWYVYHKDLGNTGIVFLSNTNAVSNSNAYWNSTTPTSSSFTVGDQTGNNSNNNTFISYNFAEVPGFSKTGIYTGNGNPDGPFIYTGFAPAWVLCKSVSGSGSPGGNDWNLLDNKMTPYNVHVNKLFPNTSGAENTSAEGTLDMVSNGFKPRGTGGSEKNNNSGTNYIYIAFGQTLVGTNNIPNNAR